MKFDIWDAVSGALALFALLRGDTRPATGNTEAGSKREKVLSSLGAFFSKQDEAFVAEILTELGPAQTEAFTRLMAAFDGVRERQAVRYVLAKMDKEARLAFVKQLLELIETHGWGIPKVVDMLRTHQLATENMVAKNALKIWKGTLDEVERAVCSFFGKKKFSEVTFDVLTQYANTLFTAKPKKRNWQKWWAAGLLLGFVIIGIFLY